MVEHATGGAGGGGGDAYQVCQGLPLDQLPGVQRRPGVPLTCRHPADNVVQTLQPLQHTIMITTRAGNEPSRSFTIRETGPSLGSLLGHDC